MSQEQLAVASQSVSTRLVQNVNQLNLAGLPLPAGNQQTVLGQAFVGAKVGTNGPRGWIDGDYERILQQEGTASINFPNRAGEDGLLHRRRFLIIQAGRPAPVAGSSAVFYQGGMFRPGDEFIEIYRDEGTGPGTLLFVLAVTSAVVTDSAIALSGYDAFWLQKKARESTVGIYANAPRDVLEHFTRQQQVVVADDFPNDSRFDYTNITGATTLGANGNMQTADGLWLYSFAWNVTASTDPYSTWNSANGTVVRLGLPNGTSGYPTGSYGSLLCRRSVAAGFRAGTDPVVRWEVRYRSAVGITSVFGFGLPATATPNAIPTTVSASVTVAASASGVTATLVGDLNGDHAITGRSDQATQPVANYNTSDWHELTIEVRDRYVFFFLDGQTLGVISTGGATDPNRGNSYFAVYAAQNSIADVDYAVLRQDVPAMLRPTDPTKLGDYCLPGAPTPGAAALQIWRTDDAPPYGTEFSPARYQASFQGVFNVPSLSLGASRPATAPAWWPNNASGQGSGGSYSGGWSARASGSIYLSLATYDYRLRVVAPYARFWLGKTRFGEQLVDSWVDPSGQVAGAKLNVTPYLKATPTVSTTVSGASSSGSRDLLVTSTPANVALGQLLAIGSGATLDLAYLVQIRSSGWWNVTGLANPHAPGEPVTVINQGLLASYAKTGWYPVLLEFASGANRGGFGDFGGSPGAVLQYERSDQPGWWANVGGSAYLHTVYSVAAARGVQTSIYYWPLNEGLAGATLASGSSNSYGGSGAASAFPAAILSADGTTAPAGISTTTSTLASGEAAPVFNGGITAGRTGDALDAGNVPISTSSWTAFATFRCDVTGAVAQDVFRKENSIFIHLDLSMTITAGARNATGFDVASATGTIRRGVWYHVVATWDGSNLRLYVNGVLQGSPVAHTVQTTNANHLIIGANASGGTTPDSEWFNGAIAHVGYVPGVVYSQADVTALYQGVSSSPHVPVSEAGIIDTTASPLRYVGYYDQLLQYANDWGYQLTAEPMQLESGEFPGRIRPQIRAGRDTEWRVGSPEIRQPTTTQIQDTINAEDVCDALLADASGIPDPSGAGNLSTEVFDFAGMMTTIGGVPTAPHAWLSREYDQSASISLLAMLEQRLASLLALRGSPWEQIAMTHLPTRQLLDTFPLSGSVAEFAWLPGDGVRLNFPEFDLVDQNPRQVLGIKWPIAPTAAGSPEISLRQRPRNFQQVLAQMMRTSLAAHRSYGGAIVLTTGTIGGTPGLADQYSRINLPSNLGNVISASLVVQVCTGSGWTIEVNDASTGQTVGAVGRFDITAYVTFLGSAPRMYARLTGGTGTVAYQVEIQQKVG